MKNKIYILLFLFMIGKSSTIFAQQEENTTPLEQSVIPTAVKNAVKKEFPNYTATQYSGIHQERTDDEFVEESNGGLIDNFEAFSVNLEGKDNELQLLATFNFDGKLLSVLSNKPNDTISPALSAKIAKNYPGWKIVNSYRHLTGSTITYFIVLNKNDNTITLYCDEDGNFVEN